MPDFLSKIYDYYYLVLILQGICLFHCVRNGNQHKWLWIIVLLPAIGCFIYIFTEMIRKNHVDTVQESVTSIVNPGKKIRDLESRFSFSDTFANRIALADAYLEKGMFEKAQELYEPALTGIFRSNISVMRNLIRAYYETGRYEDIVRIAPEIAGSREFLCSEAHICYAEALEKTGRPAQAEVEYQKMNHRFSNYGCRYRFGEFLIRNGRRSEAQELYKVMLAETENMNKVEKKSAAYWISKARQELKEGVEA